ncbi:uncharacterized protein DEA37_0008506 [Paragonimus westermani]|uniref:Uncharacterized protein n=1 Tax=Paragonimus westermani TaxID=34504 RepID=A0A5J4P279_9TREM|nr:uncharacterized protein DEA37_0008506 [Paragonimus westermani]
MPIIGRLFICSALAATLIYVLYRRKRKEKENCSYTDPISEESSALIPELLNYTSETTKLYPEYGQCLEYIAHTVPTVVKVTLCANICLARPDQITEDLYQSVQSLLPFTGTISNRSDNILMSSSDVSEAQIGPTVAVNVLERGSVSPSSGSEHALTPDSTDLASSPDVCSQNILPVGCFNDPINDIYEDNPEELNGRMIPKVLIPSDLWAEAVDRDIWHETFCVPAHMGGVLIGRLGKTPIGNPNQLRRYLPLGEAVPIHVRSLYASKELFVTIEDEGFSKYLTMQADLDRDYASANNFRMQLCEPVTSGTVAVVPHSHGFARSLILSVYSTWPKTALYLLLDHGTFGVAPLNQLKKIRAKYMRVPFQAIHVSWAHAFPVFSDVPDIHVLRTFFASGRVHAFAVRMETCCRASVAFGESYPPPYSASGLLDILVTACNSGLYMAVPLALYPNRQSWLNGTNIPYYPFKYSAIDYSALVSFVTDESLSPLVDTQQVPEDQNNPAKQFRESAERVTGGHSNRQLCQSNVSRPTRGGVSTRRPFLWHSRNSGRGGFNQKVSATSQKENQKVENQSGKVASDTIPDANGIVETVNAVEQKRRPLSVRNVRGSSTGGYRGSSIRGRGGFTHPRPRD